MAKQEIISKIEELLNEFIEGKELEIYRVEYKKEGQDWKLRVFLDKPADCEQEYVDINECEEVTRFLSDKLDEDDIIDRSYTLEVSSPGLDRELVKPSDFVRFKGREVEVKLYEAIEGGKEHTGILLSRDEENVMIDIDDKEITFPLKKISKINLAVTF